jgi:hypothetical protein
MDDRHGARRWQEKAAVAVDEYAISFWVFYIDENTSRPACNTDPCASNFANVLQNSMGRIF